MKTAIAIAAVLIATPAFAHPGHFAESYGHNHWLAMGLLALAAAIGVAALWRSRKTKPAKMAERKA
jgi:hypothetical protein